MINIIYFIVFILSVLNIVALSVVVRHQKCFYYTVFFLLICITCFGYLTIANAGTVQIAKMGNVLTYFGAAFLPYTFMLSLSNLCHVPIKKWVSLLMFTYNSFVFLLVWLSLQGSTLYYKEFEIAEVAGITVINAVDGPLHFLHDVSVIFYSAVAFLLIVKAFFNKRNVSYRNLAALIALEIGTVIFYAVEERISPEINWLNLIYVIDEFCFLVLVYRIGKYDISESVGSTLKDQEDYAYMTFDTELHYLGGSAQLLKYFPDATHVRIDKEIHAKGNPVIEKALQWLKTSLVTGSKAPLYLEVGESILKCTWSPMNNGLFGGLSGYLVEIMDETNQQKYMSLISNYNTRLEEEVEEKLLHIRAMQEQIILGMADIVESRDDSTGGHVKRTSEGVRILVEKLKELNDEYRLTKSFCRNVVKAAPMHDFGKIAVDDKILKKPGKYTAEEYEQMKVHAGKGAEIVGKVLDGVEDEEFMEIAKNIAHYHHERWDGSGYPEGKRGEEIPLEARIMALADVFDAMVSKRCYKEKMSYDEAFHVIESSLGTHFDPQLGALFLQCRPQLEQYYDSVE